ncbi:hypothetical protein [Inhella crocodyli]|uniref:Lipoprotein n=1 Tax=Inhella crocodyli TaxID=2499851 RepID=A0A3S2UJJ4_9BURK|nr:hypothetical protein [Inhella crocodyli]RVT87594.1 hypothetical protein EOD73_00775 [Inhella crocodyli]
MNAVRVAVRGLVLLSVASLMTGCIVIPGGHRHHHGHGHAAVVVPVKVERRDDRRYGDGRGHRQYRDYRDDSGPRRW